MSSRTTRQSRRKFLTAVPAAVVAASAIQHLVLDSLIPSKRDYPAGTIGGAGRTNFDVQSTRAGDQARAQLAVQGGKA